MHKALILLPLLLTACAQREALTGTNGIRVEYASQAIIGGHDGQWRPVEHAILLRYGAPDYTLAHEACHSADTLGSYRQALRLIGNPSGLDRQVAIAWRIADMADANGGDYWRALRSLYGNDAVQHPEILAQLKAPGLVAKAKK